MLAVASTWAWLSGRRRREVLEKCLSHLNEVLEVVTKAKEMVEAYSNNDRDGALKAYHRLFEAERRADNIKHKIIEELSTELFHPIDREELIRLVLAADDIADYTKAASRRLLYLDPDKVPRRVIEAYMSIAGRLVEATKKAREAISLLASSPRKAINLTHDIERLEEEVDDIRNETEEWIINQCESLTTAQCLVLTRVLESLETSTDKAEDLGDVIRSIALLNI